ncbi:precorrin-4 C(11)-methyltransferase [Methanoregula sp. UBA64]|jgi:precorrin-4/cobalt-precorrin-4 C11-methyltransferase|uniref:precorrin-4 C(11)-methyltransferase n=1 Tax=Methanoregula sp. UBA64 TaxID=1915554 RepID=UPI0025EE203C|nr:precorrin-4 C(11)-methyltransferase [Methanoregula sp. UBA64]
MTAKKENGTHGPVVWFVGAGPGDPELITVKGQRLVHDADVLIYAGSLVNPDLVAASKAPLKLDSWGMHLPEMVDVMVREAEAGKKVVRLHSGDPSLYGAIVEQIELLEARGVSVQIVPGVSSLFAAAAALKTQLTLRGVSESVIVTRPAGKTLESDQIREFSRMGQTMVVFLGTEKFSEITQKLECPKETPAAVVYHASWPDQKVVRGTVADIAEKAAAAGIEHTALLVIGGIAGETKHGHTRSHLYS